MKIVLTKHSIKRAKQRFNLNKKALLRTAQKSISNGIKIVSDNYNSTTYVYAQFCFIFKDCKEKKVLKTVTNIDAREEYKESLCEDVYVGGRSIGKKIMIRSYKC